MDIAIALQNHLEQQGVNRRMAGKHYHRYLCLIVIAVVTTSSHGCGTSASYDWSASSRVTVLDEKLQKQIHEVLTKYTGTATNPKLLGNDGIQASHLKRGKAIYEQRCAQCHGLTGEGAGPAAAYLKPLPRDYRLGVFKFTSTPYGAKPRRSDLMRTLREGVPGTAMPSFALLSDEDLQDVLDYVLVLTHRGELEQKLLDDAESAGELDTEAVPEYVNSIVERWREAEKQQVTPISRMPDYTPESIEAGRQAFLTMECSKCHGKDGRGGSLGNVQVGKDVWGHTTAAADLTSGMFRGGGRPIDIYRRIYSGINGTPMPGFAQVFEKEPDKIWHLVHFIKNVGDQRRESLPTLESMWKRPDVKNASPEQKTSTEANPREPADGR